MTSLIAAIALLTPQATQPRIVELSESGSGYITYQTVIKLPELDARGLANAAVLCNTILDGTRGYARKELTLYGSAAGRIRCSFMPDHIRLGLSVKKGQGELGADLLKELLDDARFDDKAVSDSAQREMFKQKGYWATALEPFAGDFSNVSKASVRELYRLAFTPANCFVGVGGEFAEADLEHLRTKLALWQPKPEKARYYGAGKVQFARGQSARISTADFASQSFPANAELPVKILAAAAMGAGKGSSAFRALRDKNAWSYRQESVFWPTHDGFQVRLIAAFIPTQDDDATAAKMKAAILEDVENWTDEDRERAIGMMRAILVRGVEYSPLYLAAGGTIGNGLDDRTFLAAYWTLKTGAPFSQEAFLQGLDSIQLDSLKTAAKGMLENGATVVLSGSRG